MHKPVGRVHFLVFEKFSSAYLFQIAREKSCDYLLIIYTKNITTTTNFDSARVFSSIHSTVWLKQITTFVKFKHFQDQRFQNHSAKNLEMCKVLILNQPVKHNSVYNNQQKQMFLESSSIMNARQDVFTAVLKTGERFELPKMKDITC